MPIFSRSRALVLLVLLALLLAGSSFRVAWLQTIGRQRTLSWAERQQYQREPLHARRGTIFDRNLILMAGTIETRRLYADPRFLHESFQTEPRKPADKRPLIRHLGRILDRDGDDLLDVLTANGHKRYLPLADEVDDQAAAAIEKLNIPGLGFEATSKRIYPMGSIAAHALGTVGRDDIGRGQKGLEGLELKFNDTLAGNDGYKLALKNARRQAVAVADEDYLPPRHGGHLVLTIDANIQMATEQELAEACAKVRAKSGEAIVLDPHSGEVLALANWPTFNPQNVVQEANVEDPQQARQYQALRRNRAITDPCEEGSVIKPFIAGPALMWNITRPDEIWPIPGGAYVTSYGRRVTDVHDYGPLAMWDVLVKSSNKGMAMLGGRMGNSRLHQALTSFGFGRRSGIELPGEDPGMVNPLARWTRYSTESVSQGYELMVTPLQLARAFCVFANGGRLPTLRIVRGQLNADGNIALRYDPSRPELLPQVLDRATADTMRRIMADVPVRGTARGHRSHYWNIFGKTGTAHISEGRAGYSANRYNSSFICGAPMESPRLVVAVVIHEPDRTVAHYGGAVSAPPAKNIIERTLSYLQVAPSPELPLPPAQVAQKLHNFRPEVYRRPNLPQPQQTAAATD
jgi:cell division protein FtsI/penicillin-binding protein 2